VGQDPKTGEAGGTKYANFGLASSHKKDGEKITTWVNVKCFGAMVDNVITPYVKKGSKIAVYGDMRTETYKDKDGVEKTSVVLLASRIELCGDTEGAGERKPATPPATGGW
jgi:single-strand DNA-binding protein